MSATATKSLKATVREQRGKEWAKKARKAGQLPGTVYGPGQDPVAVTLDHHDFEQVRRANLGERVLLDVELSNGSNERVFIKALQRDPVTDTVLHVDLYRVDPSKPVHLRLRVRVTGSTPQGVKDGGILETLRADVMVEALPKDLPGHLDADLSNLHMGHSFHVSDLVAVDNVKILEDADEVLFTVVGPQKTPVLDAEAAAAEAAAEPEVIGKGKDEE